MNYHDAIRAAAEHVLLGERVLYITAKIGHRTAFLDDIMTYLTARGYKPVRAPVYAVFYNGGRVDTAIVGRNMSGLRFDVAFKDASVKNSEWLRCHAAPTLRRNPVGRPAVSTTSGAIEWIKVERAVTGVGLVEAKRRFDAWYRNTPDADKKLFALRVKSMLGKAATP